jgi:GT2 family glycosyltransferase
VSGPGETPPLPSLSTSIVIFQPNFDVLRTTLHSLRAALEAARALHLIDRAAVTLVDNGTADPAALDALVAEAFEGTSWLGAVTIRGQGNVGYGVGHDLAIARSTAEYHLVLNPDVVLDRAAVGEAIKYLKSSPTTGMVTPHVENDAGDREYLCKRYPSVLTLALRGFAPGWLQRPFRRMLDRYEMRDLPEKVATTGVPIASGCFMLARSTVLHAIGGFSPAYFLYFEDFDLSLRFGRLADIAYVPQVRITHSGGYAARKGWAHRRLFVRSALTFFNRHGWKFW